MRERGRRDSSWQLNGISRRFAGARMAKKILFQGVTPETHLEAVRHVLALPAPQEIIFSMAFMNRGGLAQIREALLPVAGVTTIIAGIRNGITSAQGLAASIEYGCRTMAVDEAPRFSRSRSVPAHFGLTPARYQSGELDRGRGISKCGDSGVRWVLVEAAGIILRQNTKSSPLRVWSMALAKRRGPAKALVAVARRLAVILHRMWIDGTEYRWQTQTA